MNPPIFGIIKTSMDQLVEESSLKLAGLLKIRKVSVYEFNFRARFNNPSSI